MTALDIWKTVPLLVTLIMVIFAGVTGVVRSPSQSTQIIGFCTLSILSLITMIQQLMNSAVVAAKAQEVADKVDVAEIQQTHFRDLTNKKMDRISEVAQATHILVNSKMEQQLQLTSDLATRLAEMPGATEKDKHLATDAALKLREHKGRQYMVDHPEVQPQ